jgi:hypothetical protein
MNTQEGQEGIMNLGDDEPAVVEKMIEFCYTTQYYDDRDVGLLVIARRDREQANAAANYITQAIARDNTTPPPVPPSRRKTFERPAYHKCQGLHSR